MNNLESKYKNIENNFLKYGDLINIDKKDNNEEFCSLSKIKSKNIFVQYIKKDMEKYFSGEIIVRKKVYNKIINIIKYLKKYYPNTGLKIVYGYRSIKIQKKYFDKIYNKFKKNFPNKTENELLELSHTKVAVPEVSGHPTGGAIDLTLFNIKTKEEYKMGGKIADFNEKKKVYTYSSEITKKELKNRLFLKKIMERENFAPYLGEWWHFSFGDVEWAKFYNKKKAIYSKKNINEIIINNK